MPPLLLEANRRRRVYSRMRDLKMSNSWSREKEREIRGEEGNLLLRQWKIHIGRGYAYGRLTPTETLLGHISRRGWRGVTVN